MCEVVCCGKLGPFQSAFIFDEGFQTRLLSFRGTRRGMKRNGDGVDFAGGGALIRHQTEAQALQFAADLPVEKGRERRLGRVVRLDRTVNCNSADLLGVFIMGDKTVLADEMANILFIDRVRFAGRSLATATVTFFLTVGAVAAYLFLHFYYGASPTIIALAIIRKVLNEALMAALVDLAVSLLAVDLFTGRVTRRSSITLSELLPASITLIVLTSALVLFVGSVDRFPRDFRAFQAETKLQVQLRIGRAIFNDEPFLGLAQLQQDGITSQKVLISDQESELRTAASLNVFGCERIDDGSQVTGPNDRNTFAYWVSACHLDRVQIANRPFYYLYSIRPLAESAYRGVLLQMLGPALILFFAILLQLFVTRSLGRSLKAWKEIAEGFGRPGLSAPGKLVFSEFERPIERIVVANNGFAELVEERKGIARTVSELKQEMDLTFAADVRFDPPTSSLQFNDINMDRAAVRRIESVHPNDCMAFSEAMNAGDAFIEFRMEGENSGDWYLLVVRDLLAPGHWRSGWLVRLRQSKLAQNRMLQQARLVELGGMASALSHELKQPLFTISLCAENGRLLLDQNNGESVARTRGKLDRISEQVDRAREIIGRISGYARIEDSAPEPLYLAEVFSDALNSFLGRLK